MTKLILFLRVPNVTEQSSIVYLKKSIWDNLGVILNELPTLPTRKAILLGWAAPVPVLVDMNELKKEHQPDSKDPDYWDVWIKKKPRPIDWKLIVEEWQKVDDSRAGSEAH